MTTRTIYYADFAEAIEAAREMLAEGRRALVNWSLFDGMWEVSITLTD